MPRAVREWIGKTADTACPDEVKLRISRRQGHRCHDCTRKLDVKNKPEFDHIPALWDGGENRESKIFAVCRVPCHLNHTREDATIRAEGKRHEKKRIGIERKVRHPVRGWRRMNGEPVWNPKYGQR